ncbi:LytR C-terminal domain-containing protein [Phytoactinopolyspora halotolerans]|uniref:LytR C-terminal domain-containing protein n=1 Tax=Phytoactinopolyspora halotolerans TaxID=1981512 RepID=A0A6L9S2A3_9ACTN|nr:LytR C-terminal domain-containing protein [Phytoactinopolyspora halotolerans]NED98920.1 LytR C-terminal domain-containing protein [Phytoactinopolyspora halotolerans]
MTIRERLDRAWPSLVALVGTVGVVLALLVFFGDDTGGNDDGGDEDVAADSTDEPQDDGGGDATEPDEDASDEPTGDPTDDTDEDADEDGSDETEEPDDEPTEAPAELRTPIGIANQTSVEGLELTAADRFEAGGWEVAATSGFNGTVPETTVYYPPGLQESAEALAAQFPEVGRVAESFEGLNPSRIVVILVDDYLDEVEAEE